MARRACHGGGEPARRATLTGRVRTLLITPDGDLLAIRRVRPGQGPYWVLPGGGIEPGEDLETALARELRKEIAATADVHSLVYVLGQGGDRQFVYLARAHAWSRARDHGRPGNHRPRPR
jgi:ADP-ribose pyrophosphatase YjhB (NUDIX family)